MSKYSKVQFIAFNIKPGYTDAPTKPCPCGCTKFNPHPIDNWACQDCWINSGQKCTGFHKSYLGDTDSKKDIEYRCNVMKNAIETAYFDSNLLKAKVRRRSWNIFSKKKPVLKVFMAPEFYFRGSEGGYPVENVSQIMETMREETNHERYKDWLFVFGTAIGYQKHEETISKILNIIDIDFMEIDDVSREIVKGCIVTNQNGNVSREIMEALRFERYIPDPSKYYYNIILENKIDSSIDNFKVDELVTIQWPGKETEVFNIAMVQKGGPSPKLEKGIDPGREVIVYKEYVSRIDFLRNSSLNWDTEDERKARIHGEDDRTILPTEGSRDLLSEKVNVPGHNYKWTDSKGTKHLETISEESKRGLGGGSVFTIDDVTFGLEVCLDHAMNRLYSYYEKNADKPKPHIHLIPSWGMSIAGGKICCVDKGLVFNVDGPKGSEARIMKDSKEYCCTNEHSSDTSGVCKGCGVKLQPMGTPVQSKPSIPVVGYLKIKEYFEDEGKIEVYEAVKIPE